MILSIGAAADGVLELRDAGDCTSFKVTGRRPTTDEVRTALAGEGVLLTDDDGHAFVDPATIERLAADTADETWADRFAGMVAYATSKGWVDEEGLIRAHCEWT